VKYWAYLKCSRYKFSGASRRHRAASASQQRHSLPPRSIMTIIGRGQDTQTSSNLPHSNTQPKRFCMARGWPTLRQLADRTQSPRRANVLVYLGPPAQTPALVIQLLAKAYPATDRHSAARTACVGDLSPGEGRDARRAPTRHRSACRSVLAGCPGQRRCEPSAPEAPPLLSLPCARSAV
jgi:hypothetical protein